MKTKTLPKEFEKTPNNMYSRFVQFKRNDYAAIYQRFDKEGVVRGWEVFEVRVGQPNEFVGRKGAEEMYPGASAFGFWAWDVKDQCRAEEIFDEITKGEGKRTRGKTPVVKPIKVKVKRPGQKSGRPVGRRKTNRPTIVFPKTFTMKQLAKANAKGWTQPTLYLEIQQLLGKKVEVKERITGGRGRPQVVYRVI